MNIGPLLRAEWTKFRTVRGWVAGMVVAALATVGFGLLVSSGIVCGGAPSPGHPRGTPCTAPLGPDGEAVTDRFFFVHRPLAASGSITVRVTAISGAFAGLQPWSKAGIIIKASTRPGSAYAAMMVTGRHGVRMQDDFTQDMPGLPGAVSAASPRWLRLSRAGDTVTGYDSADGRRWIRVAAVRLAGLPATVPAGLFAASPARVSGPAASAAGPPVALGTFDHVGLRGAWPARAWTGSDIGFPSGRASAGLGGYSRSGGRLAVSGSGDIAPAVPPEATVMPIAHTLVGDFSGVIAVAVVAAMFVAAEYTHGLISVTLAATPRRGRVLAAKAIVIAAVTFVAGLAGVAAAVPLGERVLRDHGNFIAPLPVVTEVRVMAGTAAVLAVVAVFALAVGSALRSTTAAVTAVLAGVVLPYFVSVALPILPVAASDWMLRVTPAAAFAVQGTSPQYPQVSGTYLPFFGYYPVGPWTGFAVLCGWTAVALGLAAFLLRRRDA
ncbi:MAG TPA: ABC transporter permease subunit [Streptosporangiaceae bacterium]|nr:ABC transporter permease subunit [Streptosporangiaceae bacterium]